ncbi:SPOR domain-containing protein [Pseudoalteromonas sp. MEBiC 03485]|uniref:SPOR domain-containing protein n=1 Tax=Pseudoalteromonas sp. MEBiC 03485 TaxID=2571103 RepID=UPI00101ECE9E|nr:SPOR domain-containing protein [Pseudoalteromonas sp. MEBiC 03485]RZD23510.1 hypothetical protein EVU92_16380 [Pseudoalteromonas sp. MEBiC 03485]
MHFSIFSKYLLIAISLTVLTACMMSQEHSQPEQPFTHSQSAAIAAAKAVEPGVQLGLYLTPTKVSHRVLELKRDYPDVLHGLDFRFKKREHKGVTVYGLRAGPFTNYTQATAFCEIVKKLGQTCVTAPFVGQVL